MDANQGVRIIQAMEGRRFRMSDEFSDEPNRTEEADAGRCGPPPAT